MKTGMPLYHYEYRCWKINARFREDTFRGRGPRSLGNTGAPACPDYMYMPNSDSCNEAMSTILPR